MDRLDPFVAVAQNSPALELDVLWTAGVVRTGIVSCGNAGTPAVVRLHDFDALHRPVVVGVPSCPHELLPARATVALQQDCLGRDAVVLFEGGDPRAPIIVGLVEPAAPPARPQSQDRGVTLHSDCQQHVVEAAREIVLRCGAASITLTRAGKVIIEGSYVLSRSSGYNKIKGAAVDIN